MIFVEKKLVLETFIVLIYTSLYCLFTVYIPVGIYMFKVNIRNTRTLIHVNCRNSRTSDDIDLRLGPVTKLEERNKTMSKKFENDVISANCDVIVIFLIFGQFGAVRKPDSGCIIRKTSISAPLKSPPRLGLKSDSHLPNKFFYLLQWKLFKNDENCFLFYLKSSVHSENI